MPSNLEGNDGGEDDDDFSIGRHLEVVEPDPPDPGWINNVSSTDDPEGESGDTRISEPDHRERYLEVSIEPRDSDHVATSTRQNGRESPGIEMGYAASPPMGQSLMHRSFVEYNFPDNSQRTREEPGSRNWQADVDEPRGMDSNLEDVELAYAASRPRPPLGQSLMQSSIVVHKSPDHGQRTREETGSKIRQAAGLKTTGLENEDEPRRMDFDLGGVGLGYEASMPSPPLGQTPIDSSFDEHNSSDRDQRTREESGSKIRQAAGLKITGLEDEDEPRGMDSDLRLISSSEPISVDDHDNGLDVYQRPDAELELSDEDLACVLKILNENVNSHQWRVDATDPPPDTRHGRYEDSKVVPAAARLERTTGKRSNEPQDPGSATKQSRRSRNRSNNGTSSPCRPDGQTKTEGIDDAASPDPLFMGSDSRSRFQHIEPKPPHHHNMETINSKAAPSKEKRKEGQITNTKSKTLSQDETLSDEKESSDAALEMRVQNEKNENNKRGPHKMKRFCFPPYSRLVNAGSQTSDGHDNRERDSDTVPKATVNGISPLPEETRVPAEISNDMRLGDRVKFVSEEAMTSKDLVGGHPCTPPTAGGKAADGDSLSPSFSPLGEENFFSMAGIMVDDASDDGLHGSTMYQPTSPVHNEARLPCPIHANDSDDETECAPSHVEGANLKSTGLEESSGQYQPPDEEPNRKENEVDSHIPAEWMDDVLQILVKEHPEYNGVLTEHQRISIADFIVLSLKEYERLYFAERQLCRDDFMELFRLAVHRDHVILLPDVLPLEHFEIASNHDSLRLRTGSMLDAPSNAAEDEDEPPSNTKTEDKIDVRYNCGICGKPKRNHICIPDSNEPTLHAEDLEEVENTNTSAAQPDKPRLVTYIRLFDAGSQVSDSQHLPEGDLEANARVNRTSPLMAEETRIPAEISNDMRPGDRVKFVSEEAMKRLENEGRESEVQRDITDSNLQHQEERELNVSSKVIKQIEQEIVERQARLDAISQGIGDHAGRGLTEGDHTAPSLDAHEPERMEGESLSNEPDDEEEERSDGRDAPVLDKEDKPQEEGRD